MAQPLVTGKGYTVALRHDDLELSIELRFTQQVDVFETVKPDLNGIVSVKPRIFSNGSLYEKTVSLRCVKFEGLYSMEQSVSYHDPHFPVRLKHLLASVIRGPFGTVQEQHATGVKDPVWLYSKKSREFYVASAWVSKDVLDARARLSHPMSFVEVDESSETLLVTLLWLLNGRAWEAESWPVTLRCLALANYWAASASLKACFRGPHCNQSFYHAVDPIILQHPSTMGEYNELAAVADGFPVLGPILQNMVKRRPLHYLLLPGGPPAPSIVTTVMLLPDIALFVGACWAAGVLDPCWVASLEAMGNTLDGFVEQYVGGLSAAQADALDVGDWKLQALLLTMESRYTKGCRKGQGIVSKAVGSVKDAMENSDRAAMLHSVAKARDPVMARVAAVVIVAAG